MARTHWVVFVRAHSVSGSLMSVCSRRQGSPVGLQAPQTLAHRRCLSITGGFAEPPAWLLTWVVWPFPFSGPSVAPEHNPPCSQEGLLCQGGTHCEPSTDPVLCVREGLGAGGQPGHGPALHSCCRTVSQSSLPFLFLCVPEAKSHPASVCPVPSMFIGGRVGVCDRPRDCV